VPDRRAVLGVRGEDAAARFYQSAGYTVLARNWRCAEGEIDLVVRHPTGEVLVFCEVKTRTGAAFGSPFEAVTPLKQRRLRRLARRWLATARPPGARADRLRFDVAAVSARNGSLELDVLEDAF